MEILLDSIKLFALRRCAGLLLRQFHVFYAEIRHVASHELLILFLMRNLHFCDYLWNESWPQKKFFQVFTWSFKHFCSQLKILIITPELIFS